MPSSRHWSLPNRLQAGNGAANGKAGAPAMADGGLESRGWLAVGHIHRGGSRLGTAAAAAVQPVRFLRGAPVGEALGGLLIYCRHERMSERREVV